MQSYRLRRKVWSIAVGLVLFIIALGCNEHGLIPLDRAITAERNDITTQTETNEIDILWIIDNSNSMCQEQELLLENFDVFIEGLAGIGADFRIAVVTTDMRSDNGQFQVAPGQLLGDECGMASAPTDCGEVTGPVLLAADYLTDPTDPTSEVLLEDLQHDFSCIAAVGTSGDGFEKGLDAMQTALSANLLDTVNTGFRRQGAWLAIIFVTDENDCSDGGALDLATGPQCEWLRSELRPVDFFTDFIANNVVGTDAGERVLVAGIIGPDDGVRVDEPNAPAASCTSATRGQAFAGYRYEEFIEAYEDRGVVANICEGSFQAALDQIAFVIRQNLATNCLRTQPPQCETNEDCDGDAICYNPGDPTLGIEVCSDFDVNVEVRYEGDPEWTELMSNEDVADGEDFGYRVDFDAPTGCASGAGIAFEPAATPGPGDEFRIRYAVPIQTDVAPESSPADETQ